MAYHYPLTLSIKRLTRSINQITGMLILTMVITIVGCGFLSIKVEAISAKLDTIIGSAEAGPGLIAEEGARTRQEMATMTASINAATEAWRHQAPPPAR